MTQKLASLMVDRETANLVHTYCVFHDVKMQDFVSQALREKLGDFEARLKQLRFHENRK
ncbi:Uncharacterised protein [uncultured archaeon]|nr:Uncharacterised protein [uncultured archaeon]